MPGMPVKGAFNRVQACQPVVERDCEFIAFKTRETLEEIHPSGFVFLSAHQDL